MKKFIFFGIICLGIFLDFGTKYFFHGPFQEIVFGDAIQNLHSYFPIFGDFFGIQLIYNTGIAFGMPIRGIFLKIITLAIIGGLAYYYTRYERPKQNQCIDVAFACIFAGAFSHGYERIFVGQVIDFFSIKYFAIFNVADIFITIGGILLLYAYYAYEWIDSKQ